MNEFDLENLASIIHEYIVKHKCDIPTDDSYTKAQKDWHILHANYVQKNILDKIIAGVQK